MSLTSPSVVRALLESLDIRPRKALGQNFLIDRNILDIFIDAAEPAADDCVLEVGPGLGVVTAPLLRRVRQVVAVEKDAKLHAYLQGEYGFRRTLVLVHGDVLGLLEDAGAGTGESVLRGVNKVVSNLPYSTGSRILVGLSRLPEPPRFMCVTVQKEVAARLAAGAGSPDYGLLSVWIQLDYTVELVKPVSPTCFWPRPEVASTIVRIVARGERRGTGEERAYFFELTRQAFQHRRKQLAGILARAPQPFHMPSVDSHAILAAIGLPPEARPEELTPDAWWVFASIVRAAARAKAGDPMAC